MVKNYILIALRNLQKNKTFSAINIAGLAVGIGAALLLFQYAAFELSFDRFHQPGMVSRTGAAMKVLSN